MNLKQCEQILNSPKGLQLVFDEVEKIKQLINKIKEQYIEFASKIIINDNKHHISDIKFNGYTLLIQLNFKYTQLAEDSYLLFAIFNGYIDENGKEDISYPVTKREITRYNFSYNNDCEFGWHNKENENEFYKSEDITKIWFDIFFKEAIKE